VPVYMRAVLAALLILLVSAAAPAEEASLPETAIELAVGTCWEPAAAEEGLVWISSDETVAAVDGNGVITGLAKGTAVVTAVPADGGKAGARVTVTVDEYELVFTDSGPLNARFDYLAGKFRVWGTVRNGNVSIGTINGLYGIYGEPGERRSQLFEVTPLRTGPDLITITAGELRTEISVYVTQAAGREMEEADSFCLENR